MSSPAAIGRREAAKIQNRQAILVAAREVFARLGYAAATVRDIIRVTPLASGTFYNYFKSKEDIYQALSDAIAASFRPRLHQAHAAAPNAEIFLGASFQLLSEMAAAIRAGTGQDDAFRVRMDSPQMAGAFDDLVRDLEDAMRRGLFAPTDARFLAAAITGTAFEVSERMPADAMEAASGMAAALFASGLKVLPQPVTDYAAAGQA